MYWGEVMVDEVNKSSLNGNMQGIKYLQNGSNIISEKN